MRSQEEIKRELGSLKDTLEAIVSRVTDLESEIGLMGSDSTSVTYAGHVVTGGATHNWSRVITTVDALLSCSEERVAQLFSAFSSPTRVAILKSLLSGPKTCCELMSLTDAGTTGQLYHHLKELQLSGYVEQSGKAYQIDPEAAPIILTVLAMCADPRTQWLVRPPCRCRSSGLGASSGSCIQAERTSTQTKGDD